MNGSSTNFITSSIGRKILMSFTGLFLISFLIVHLTGNISLFYNDNGYTFNAYTKFMSTNVVIRILEVGLLIGILAHVYLAWKLTRTNSTARPAGYAVNKPSENSSWFSRNMGISGSIVLLFLIIHIQNFWYTFKFGEVGTASYTNELGLTETYKDMYGLVKTMFQQVPLYVGLYVLAMVLLGFHLAHGFESAFQSLGLKHKKYSPVIRKIGLGFSILVPAGFAAMPIYFFLTGIIGK